MPKVKYPRGTELALTVQEAAQKLGVSEHLAWVMVWSGQLRSVKFGNKLRRVPRTAITELLEGKDARATGSG
jgi:excisionase family DNA binding protein